MRDRVRVEISNCHGDDYIHCVTSVTASCGEHIVTWKIPDRLMRRPEVVLAVSEEIVNELQHYIEHTVPLVNRFRSAS